MPKYRDAPKSEMDSQRALLDSLMGINRNNDREEDQVTDYRDERVCKYFLVGMCPNGKYACRCVCERYSLIAFAKSICRYIREYKNG